MWRTTGFNDSTWAFGPAELGDGDGDEATTVSFGPVSTDKHITTYFRHSFTVGDPSQYPYLQLWLLRDDGAAGREIRVDSGHPQSRVAAGKD